jgi:hypothetical protein
MREPFFARGLHAKNTEETPCGTLLARDSHGGKHEASMQNAGDIPAWKKTGGELHAGPLLDRVLHAETREKSACCTMRDPLQCGPAWDQHGDKTLEGLTHIQERLA